MKVTVSPRPVDASADVVVVPFFDDRKPGPGATSAVPGVDVVAAVKASPSFRGGLGDAPLVVPPSAPKMPTVVIVGLGARASASADAVRTAALRASVTIRGKRRVATTLGQVGDDRAASVRAAIEGAFLGSYQRPRPENAARPAHESVPGALVVLVDADEAKDAAVKEAAVRGIVTGEISLWVRTLVDLPPSHLTPTMLADEVRREAEAAGVHVKVWTRETMHENGFGGILAVSKGSEEEPRVVELCYGDQTSPLGLVGKGLTFDAGGINLKRPMSEVHWMTCDMASSAAVAGAVIGAARLGLDVGVCALLPMTENMPSGSATRPGDVVTHPDGTTTEVLDTDCEGRVVLADGIAHLVMNGASGVIDVGTLTDAGGFGPSLFAAASTDDDLVAEVLAAGAAGGEHGARLPLVPAYSELMRSPVADLINGPIDIADSAVLAATYLRHFARETPWVHLDVGSTAWLERDWNGFPQGPTGVPLRTLLRLLEGRDQA